MSAIKRFNEDISVILGELGQKDDLGDKYTGQLDELVFTIGSQIADAMFLADELGNATEPETVESLHNMLDRLLGSENRLLHKAFLKYQALEEERNEKAIDSN